VNARLNLVFFVVTSFTACSLFVDLEPQNATVDAAALPSDAALLIDTSPLGTLDAGADAIETGTGTGCKGVDRNTMFCEDFDEPLVRIVPEFENRGEMTVVGDGGASSPPNYQEFALFAIDAGQRDAVSALVQTAAYGPSRFWEFRFRLRLRSTVLMKILSINVGRGLLILDTQALGLSVATSGQVADGGDVYGDGPRNAISDFNSWTTVVLRLDVAGRVSLQVNAAPAVIGGLPSTASLATGPVAPAFRFGPIYQDGPGPAGKYDIDDVTVRPLTAFDAP
jgi:hypothetical protein